MSVESFRMSCQRRGRRKAFARLRSAKISLRSRFLRAAVMSVNADSLKAALATAYPDATHVETIDLSGGCGSSFEIVVVSPSFEKKSTLARHRQGQSSRTLSTILASSQRCRFSQFEDCSGNRSITRILAKDVHTGRVREDYDESMRLVGQASERTVGSSTENIDIVKMQSIASRITTTICDSHTRILLGSW